MQRWHLTLGLSVSAAAAVLIAPRLLGAPTSVPTKTTIATPPPPEPPAITSQGTLQIEAGLDRTAIAAGQVQERFVTVTVTAPEGGETLRNPANLAVVMDVSGSMGDQGRIKKAREAAKALVRGLSHQDTFSLVVFSDNARVMLPAGPVHDVSRAERVIDQILDNGGTNLHAGMNLGLRQLRTVLDANEVGRMVILSDGYANVGIKTPSALAQFSQDIARDGVSVSTVGLGYDFNEDLLARMADLGGGAYHFADRPDFLETILTQELTHSTTLAARNLRVDLDVPANVEVLDIIGWEARQNARGWSVYMGDVPAGTTRKVVARVRVRGQGDEGLMPIANVQATYSDLILGGNGWAKTDVEARASHDANVVATSVDATNLAASQQAWANHYLELSTREYERGNVRQAEQLMSQGATVLEEAAEISGNAGLKKDALDIQMLGTVMTEAAPDSPAAKRAIKKNKEHIRVLTR